MDELVRKLRKTALKLEQSQEQIIYLNHEGDNICRLINHCMTTGDMIELARKINDGVVLDTEQYQELHEDSDERKEENDGYREEIEALEQDSDDHMIIDDDSDSLSADDHKMFEALLDELDIDGDWSTLKELYDDLGYDSPNIDLYMDGWQDLFDVLEELYDNKENIFETKWQIYRRFLTGDFGLDQLIEFNTALIKYLEDGRDDHLDQDYYDINFDEEEDAEEEESNLIFYQMTLDSGLYIMGWDEKVEAVKDDSEALEALYDQVEVFRDQHDEREEADTRKRMRKEFDNEDNPIEEIEFEQEQTDFLIYPTYFKRLCQEILQDYMEDAKFDDDAIEILQHVGEDMLLQMFQETNRDAIHAGRTHINDKDMRLWYSRNDRDIW